MGHTGEHTYRCDICDKSFSGLDNLTSDQPHKRETGENTTDKSSNQKSF